MNVAEVERETGLTRANIRFYEKEGLLSPARGENGYRAYTAEDVLTLRKIRLLRQLRLSVPEIKRIQVGEQPLPEAAEKQIAVLEGDIREGEQAKAVCQAICADRAGWANMDVDKYLSLSLLSVHQRGDDVTAHDRAEPAGMPWRRYFARGLDLALYGLPVTLVEMWLLRINPRLMSGAASLLEMLVTTYLAIGLMLLIEPVLLHHWGTTPGKWIFGLSVRGVDGEKLSLSDAFGRTYGVFRVGMGWGIPFYQWYCEYCSWRDCRSQELEWDEEGDCAVVVREREVKPWRVLCFLAAEVLCIALLVGIMLRAELPPHRGELTLAEYVDNCNDYLAYNGYYPRVNVDGSWNAQPEADGTSIYIDLEAPDLIAMQVETDADGLVSAVTVQSEGTWPCGGAARDTAFFAFAAAHEKRGLLRLLHDPAVKLADSGGWALDVADGRDRVEQDFGALEIIYDCEYSGFSAAALEQDAPRSYRSVYTIRVRET